MINDDIFNYYKSNLLENEQFDLDDLDFNIDYTEEQIRYILTSYTSICINFDDNLYYVLVLVLI